MKLKAAQKVHYDSGPNMTPLVDIVMVILIFLMLTGSLAAGEWWLESTTPLVQKGAGNAEVPKDYVPDTPINIDLESTGEKTWSAKVEGSQERDRTHDDLKRRLQEKLKYLLEAKQTPDKIQVYIRPRRATRYAHLLAAWDATLDAGLKKISFMMAEAGE